MSTSANPQHWLNIQDEDRRFIRDGCLVMMLAMSWDMIDGSGSYLKARIGSCHKAITGLQVEDENAGKLIRAVQLALETAEQAHGNLKELEELSVWVNDEYVRGYFRRMAHMRST